jgi:hypothetical protein
VRLPLATLLLVAACTSADTPPKHTGAADDSASTDDSAATDDSASTGDSAPPDDSGDSGEPPTEATVQVVMQQVRPLLARDEAVTVDVTLSDTADLLDEGWATVDLQLVGTAADGSEIELARADAVALAEDAVVVLSWTPTVLGVRDLTAQATLAGFAVGESAPWRVAVTPTRVHVHQWQADPDAHHWVSALLAPSSLGGAAADDAVWLARGAQPLQWKGDDWAGDDAEAFADYLVDGLGEAVTGIVVDEMFSGSDHDQVVGRAISLVREEHPELYLASYSQGASGDDMIAGLAASDLALVEVYPNDFREYEGYGARLQQAIDVGLEGHALPALSLYGATHEAELWQQVVYYRTHFPDLPGIAFFGSPASAALRAAMDDLVEAAFLAPALVVEASSSAVTVRNVGGDDASDVQVSFLAADGSVADEVELGTIAAGDVAAAATTEDYAEAVVSAAEGVTVLAWTDPREVEPDATAADAWWSGLVAGATESDLFAGRPDIEEQYTGSLLTHATLPLGTTSSFGLELTFELVDATIYGEAGLGVTSSDASLLLSLYRGEYDTDLASQRVRATLTWTGPDGVEVTTLVPVGLIPGTYSVRLGYNDTSVRASIHDATGALVADTGSLAIDGPFAPDTLVLDVRDDGPSEVSWDGSGAERIWVHGAVGASFYVQAWVSNVTAFAP